MSRTLDQAALQRAHRFLSELKTINPQMTLTEAIVLLDVAAHETGNPLADGQPPRGMSMQMIQQKHFPNSTRQHLSRAMRTLETGFDARGNGDGIQLVELFTPDGATDRRTKAVRLKPVMRGHLLQAVRNVFPQEQETYLNETDNPNQENQMAEASPGK
jgi:hypothetical protein